MRRHEGKILTLEPVLVFRGPVLDQNQGGRAAGRPLEPGVPGLGVNPGMLPSGVAIKPVGDSRQPVAGVAHHYVQGGGMKLFKKANESQNKTPAADKFTINNFMKFGFGVGFIIPIIIFYGAVFINDSRTNLDDPPPIEIIGIIAGIIGSAVGLFIGIIVKISRLICKLFSTSNSDGCSSRSGL